MPAFSRLGAYDRQLFEDVAYGDHRALFEYWGHEASLIPFASFPLLRWRMTRAARGEGTYTSVWNFARENRPLVAKVLARIRSDGPMAASQFEGGKGEGSWWGWSDVKRALEFLFWTGQITTASRRNSFERVYDLTERVIPAQYLATEVSEADAHRALVCIAMRALGVATELDLRDYFRLSPLDARNALATLVDAGTIARCTVEGWKGAAYIDPAAGVPRAVEASAILSPFDPIVWNRPRAKRLFTFDYRIEIYTPAHKRVHGYYVLPYLLGDTLVGRVDVKADRALKTLRVHAMYFENLAQKHAIRERLLADLRVMARWLQLERVALPVGRARA